MRPIDPDGCGLRPCRSRLAAVRLRGSASTVTEADVPPAEGPSPTSPSGATGWQPALPGIGLALGAGIGMAVSLLVSTAPAAMVIGVIAGAGLGLVIGASARGHVGGGGAETRP